jgi:hypothetical protein
MSADTSSFRLHQPSDKSSGDFIRPLPDQSQAGRRDISSTERIQRDPVALAKLHGADKPETGQHVRTAVEHHSPKVSGVVDP